MLATEPFQPHLDRAIGALSALQGPVSSEQRVVQALTIVDDLLDGTLRQHTLPIEASRVIRQCFGILCSCLRDGWQVVGESPGVVFRVTGRVCEVLRFQDEAVMFVASQLLLLLALSAPRVLLQVPQSKDALASLLAQPVSSPVAVIGVQILGRLLACGLNLRTSRSGAVIELAASCPLQHCDLPDDHVKRLISPRTIHALCALLGGCVWQWGPQGVSLARRIMAVVSLLLHKNEQGRGEYFPGLTKQLVAQSVPFLLLQVLRVSMELHCPVSLLAANDLLQQFCGAENSVAEEFARKVINPNIQLGVGDDGPYSASSATSCLLWLSLLAVTVRRSEALKPERVMEVFKAQHVLKRLTRILATVDATVDAGWFLSANHVVTEVLTALLLKLPATEVGSKALQRGIHQAGLLEATHRSLNSLSTLVKKLCQVGEEAESDSAELEPALNVYCGLLFFQTQAQHNNPTVAAHCASTGSLGIVLEALRLYSKFLCAFKDPDLARLGARVLENCLVLLDSTLFLCFESRGNGISQVVQEFIGRGGAAVLVDQLQTLASNPFLEMAQRISALKKRLQCLLSLSRCIRGGSRMQRGDVLEEVGIKRALEGIQLFVEDVVGYWRDGRSSDDLKSTMQIFRALKDVYG